MNSSEVLIGSLGGDHVLLRNWRRLPEGWTRADADVRCGPWQGWIKVEFYADELSRFAEEIRRLYKELRGTATLDPTEPHLKLKLTGDGRGVVEVDGVAQSQFEVDTRLSFHFVIDQTFLPRILDGIRAQCAR